MSRQLSVLMTVYNNPAYVSKAIESVLQQSYADFHYVIVNDGSGPSTSQLLRAYAGKDERIVLLEQNNLGIVKAILNGMRAIRTPYVARMDADDICLPDRFHKQLEFLSRNPSVVAVGGQAISIDEDGDKIAHMDQPADHGSIVEQLLEIRKFAAPIIHPAAMFRKDAYDRAGGYRSEFELAEDRDLWLRLSEVGELSNVDDLVLYYRVHAASTTRSRRSEQAQFARRAVNEARARRGLPAIERPVCDIPVQTTRFSLHASVARGAAKSGFARSAAKHALIALREKPWSSVSLKLALSVSWNLLRSLTRRSANYLRPNFL